MSDAAAPRPAPRRQLPELEPETAFFWTAGADGRLLVQRCAACDHFIHPPLPRCPQCGDDRVAPAAVSGRGRVKTFTINHQPWLPGMVVPFTFAAVELAEQAELYILTNIVDCPVDQVHAGMAVTVAFEPLEDVFLPLFRPMETRHGA